MRKRIWAGIALGAVLLGTGGYFAQFRPIVTPVPVEQVDAISQKTGLADCFWNAVSTRGGAGRLSGFRCNLLDFAVRLAGGIFAWVQRRVSARETHVI